MSACSVPSLSCWPVPIHFVVAMRHSHALGREQCVVKCLGTCSGGFNHKEDTCVTISAYGLLKLSPFTILANCVINCIFLWRVSELVCSSLYIFSSMLPSRLSNASSRLVFIVLCHFTNGTNLAWSIETGSRISSSSIANVLGYILTTLNEPNVVGIRFLYDSVPSGSATEAVSDVWSTKHSVQL